MHLRSSSVLNPVAIAFGPIGYCLKKALVISLNGLSSLHSTILNYPGRSGQSQLQLIVTKYLRDYCKLDANFHNPVGSHKGSTLRLRA
jgi:hypothetical protein